MTSRAALAEYGTLIEPATLKIERLLPGPIERVWGYLADSELRRKWLAAGPMDPRAGATVELVWRNDELTNPPGQRPAGFPDEHRMICEVVECDPPRKLVITWAGSGNVSFELEPRGEKVQLTLIHCRMPDRKMALMFGAGWHMHLDILFARLAGIAPQPFWDGWHRLQGEYDKRWPVA
ncbi:MAG: ATPase [Methylocystaceae bacterium]|nr:MAG: ATPase [Methylocystaceae bacterium]